MWWREKKFILFLKAVVGIALIGFILWYINIPQLIEVLWQVNIPLIIGAIIIYFFLTFLITFKLYKALEYIRQKISFKLVYWTNLFGMLCSDFTPGRFGYASLAYLLKKRANVKVTDSLSCVGTIGAIDLIMKGSFAIVGLIFVISVTGSSALLQTALISIFIVMLFSFAFLILCWKDVKLLNKIIKKIPVVGDKIHGLINEFKHASRSLKSKTWVFVGLNLIGWVIRGFEWSLIGWACGINLPFLTFFFLHPILTIIRYVPLTPAGIGMFEGVTILGFSLFGIPAENALLLSFFDRIDNVVVDLFAVKEVKHL